MTATQNGDTAVLGNSNTWKSSNWWNSDSYELICNETGSVTFSINKVSGQSDPVLSFIEIQKVLNLTALKEAMVEAAGRSIALKGAATQEEIDMPLPRWGHEPNDENSKIVKGGSDATFNRHWPVLRRFWMIQR